MKISQDYQLDAIVSNDPARPELNHVWLDPEREQAFVTNGKAIAFVPAIPEEDDVQVLRGVSAQMFELAENRWFKNVGSVKCLKITDTGTETELNHGFHIGESLTVISLNENTNDLSPFSAGKVVQGLNMDPSVYVRAYPLNVSFSVCLDVGLLTQLMKALGDFSDCVKLEIPVSGDSKAIVVKPLHGGRTFGLLMPLGNPEPDKAEDAS